MSLRHKGNGERVRHADDVLELGAHTDLSNGGSGRIRWKVANGYDAKCSQNNGMRKGLFLDTWGGIGNMQLEAHEDGPCSDLHCGALVCGSIVGYVETGI